MKYLRWVSFSKLISLHGHYHQPASTIARLPTWTAQKDDGHHLKVIEWHPIIIPSRLLHKQKIPFSFGRPAWQNPIYLIPKLKRRCSRSLGRHVLQLPPSISTASPRSGVSNLWSWHAPTACDLPFSDAATNNPESQDNHDMSWNSQNGNKIYLWSSEPPVTIMK